MKNASYRPSYESLAVADDLKSEVQNLRNLAEQIDMEANSAARTDPRVRHHLTWAAEQVRSWADDAQLVNDIGDGLDRRTALDAAMTRRAITLNFLHAWRGPLGRTDD